MAPAPHNSQGPGRFGAAGVRFAVVYSERSRPAATCSVAKTAAIRTVSVPPASLATLASSSGSRLRVGASLTPGQLLAPQPRAFNSDFQLGRHRKVSLPALGNSVGILQERLDSKLPSRQGFSKCRTRCAGRTCHPEMMPIQGWILCALAHIGACSFSWSARYAGKA